MAKVTPHVTDCVVAELEKLGPKYRVALRIAQQLGENINTFENTATIILIQNILKKSYLKESLTFFFQIYNS